MYVYIYAYVYILHVFTYVHEPAVNRMPFAMRPGGIVAVTHDDLLMYRLIHCHLSESCAFMHFREVVLYMPSKPHFRNSGQRALLKHSAGLRAVQLPWASPE